MAQVWAGEHVLSATPVAVKLLTPELGDRERIGMLFRNEARAMARLQHPNIVTVFDYGSVSDAVARQSQGQLARGSPYLVMERAELGTVSEARPMSWAALRYVIISLLDALAHAPPGRGV